MDFRKRLHQSKLSYAEGMGTSTYSMPALLLGRIEVLELKEYLDSSGLSEWLRFQPTPEDDFKGAMCMVEGLLVYPVEAESCFQLVSLKGAEIIKRAKPIEKIIHEAISYALSQMTREQIQSMDWVSRQYGE